MDPWEELTEAIEQLDETKVSFHNIMGQLTREMEDASSHLASVKTSLKECITDQETLLEKRKIKLDSEEKLLEAMKDGLKSKENDLERRKAGLDSRESELDSREKSLEAMKDGAENDLERRKAELDSEAKSLKAMEDGVRSKENDLERRKAELDSREKRLEAMKEHRPVRARKPAVKRLISEIYNDSPKELNGPGDALEDTPNVAYKLRLKEKLDNLVKERLVEMCSILGLHVSKASMRRVDIVVKLMEFLEAPHAEIEESSKVVKRKRTSTGSPPSKSSAKSRRNKADDKSDQKKPKKAKQISGKRTEKGYAS